MTFKMLKTERTLTVYNFAADTREFIGAGDAYIPPQTGLPACCTEIKPPDTTEGNITVFDEQKKRWLLIEDHRGKVVYDTATGQALLIADPGPLPAGTTEKSPASAFDRWNGSEWVKDDAAEKAASIDEAGARRAELLQTANEHIGPLQDAVDLGMADEREEAALLVWKKYRVLLYRVDVGTAPDIAWPVTPE
jgi:hypothetical protein